jgi:hypothetical protein
MYPSYADAPDLVSLDLVTLTVCFQEFLDKGAFVISV